MAEAVEKLLAVFGAMGVTREAVEKRLGHRIDAIQPAQIIAFRKIYTSIKDGMSEPKDWFEMPEAAPDGGEASAKPEQSAASTAAAPRTRKPRESAPTQAASMLSPSVSRDAATAAAPATATISAVDAGNAPSSQTGTSPSGRKQESAPAAQATLEQQPEPQGPALSHDSHTGEVFGPASSSTMILCPNSDKMVDEFDCIGKSCHNGCPQFM